MTETTIYFGPPGCGKTQTLMSEVQTALSKGVAPERIAFVAFSRKAASEAKSRAISDLGLTEDNLIYWRTLHSTAARQLGVYGSDLLTREHWTHLGDLLDLEFRSMDEAGRVMMSLMLHAQGVKVQHLYSIARATKRPLKEIWKEQGQKHVAWKIVDQFARTLVAYKEHYQLMDYADLLDSAPGALPVEIAFIDEAQDLTPAQWEYAHKVISKAEQVFIAGDDDQCLYDWAGGDVSKFLELKGERRVLNKSYRLPEQVYQKAQTIVAKIKSRFPKEWESNQSQGEVNDIADISQLAVHEGEWLLLARTRALLDHWEELCISEGVPYTKLGIASVKPREVQAIQAWETYRSGRPVKGGSLSLAFTLSGRKEKLSPETPYTRTEEPRLPIWHEALYNIPPARRRYYEACLRRSTKALTDPSKVTLSTIHGAKGGEAQHVGLLTDITPQVEDGLEQFPDPEHRVWYVAATRAKETLNLVRPITMRSYSI